jgi:hypothetical protein
MFIEMLSDFLIPYGISTVRKRWSQKKVEEKLPPVSNICFTVLDNMAFHCPDKLLFCGTCGKRKL